MTRTAKAALLDRLEAELAYTRGQIARAHSRPLGGALEPKHANNEIETAFRDGWAKLDALIASGAVAA